ncbi:MAG: BsuPI-related putative proteinase inhibitor [Acidobacteriota bacterium]
MKQIVFLSLLSLVGFAPLEADPFPLVAGSAWVYRNASGSELMTIRVGEAAERGGLVFHRLEGYAPKPIWVRQASPKVYTYWDEARRKEGVLWRFDGEEFMALATDCGQSGALSPSASPYRGPIGYFEQVLAIDYRPGRCADAGLTREIFGPWLGLLERRETTLAGERTLSLVYAQIGGITYVQEPSLQFSLSLALTESTVQTRLILHNRDGREIVLRFPSGQEFDFIIRNEAGQVVYRWSEDKFFTQAEVTRRIQGEAIWQTAVPVGTLRRGLYSVEGLLVNTDGQRFSATVPLLLP